MTTRTLRYPMLRPIPQATWYMVFDMNRRRGLDAPNTRRGAGAWTVTVHVDDYPKVLAHLQALDLQRGDRPYTPP